MSQVSHSANLLSILPVSYKQYDHVLFGPSFLSSRSASQKPRKIASIFLSVMTLFIQLNIHILHCLAVAKIDFIVNNWATVRSVCFFRLNCSTCELSFSNKDDFLRCLKTSFLFPVETVSIPVHFECRLERRLFSFSFSLSFQLLKVCNREGMTFLKWTRPRHLGLSAHNCRLNFT